MRPKRAYLRQKPTLYFDENFPQQVIDAAKLSGPLRNSFKLLSVFDFNNQGRDDQFQLGFCKSRGFVLVTLDKDFMDDRRYPIQNLPGMIVVSAAKNRSNAPVVRLRLVLGDLWSEICGQTGSVSERSPDNRSKKQKREINTAVAALLPWNVSHGFLFLPFGDGKAARGIQRHEHCGESLMHRQWQHGSGIVLRDCAWRR